MDTIYCSHRWLLWSVLIVLLNQCLEVSGSGRVCPQGQLIHRNLQYITCCYPTTCGVGEHVRPCTINGTKDTCQMCSPYQNQSLRTSSFTMDQCTHWPLDSDCRITVNQRNTKDERTRRCMCNIELGKKFVPPESEFPGAPMDSYCQRRNIPCKPGHEPMVDGGCQPCKENYFNPEEGFRLCQPKTNCSMLGLNFIFHSNASADNNCSDPDPITTPKPYVPDTKSPSTVSPKSPEVPSIQTSTTATTTQDTGRIGPSQDLGHDDDNNFPWPVIGVIVFLVLLVACIVLVMFWRNRKGMSVWVCASNKNCTDPEKNYTQGSSVLHAAHRSKHGMGDGCIIPQHLTDGDKVINNNINGGVPCGMGYIPNGHPNGNVHHAVYNHTDHGNGDSRFYMDPHQFCLVPTSRPGILRSTNHNVVYGQTQGNIRDRSIDSIGQEKLQVHVDELEANQDLGENDPLLVTDHLRGVAAPCQIQNQAVSGNTPPAIQANVNPLHLLAYNGRANFGPNFVHSGASSPPMQPHRPVVTYAPATGAVTFTRSTSVIASPEGEVDEDEIEARLPRLSQLLTEGDNSSTIECTPTVRDFFRADSPGRETTQQLRAPSQRLIKDQYHPQKNANQQPRRQVNHPTPQQRPGFRPALVGPVPQRGHQLNQPDHRIMNLKEQQLEESLNSTSNDPPTDGQPKVDPNVSTPKTVETGTEETQQTELKAYMRPPVGFSTGASVYEKDAKVEQEITQTTEPKLVENGRSNQNLMDRKQQVCDGNGGQNTLDRQKQVPVGTNVQNISDRKRVPSGGSNSSGQNTLERQRAPSGDQQRPCIKNSSSEEADSNVKKPHHRYNRTVSFEENENPQLVTKPRGPSTETRLSTKSNNSPEKVTADPRYRGPLRSVSDPEQKNMVQIDSDGEETERKCISLEYNGSNGSSKTSVNSDLSGTDSSSSSPSRAALYRRSQSENTTSSSESSHKPPPRSMSEEKPQKLDRPIAKVKPMPASDNAVNLLPEVSDDTGATPVATVNASHNAGGGAFHEHSSDESDREDNSERNLLTTSALGEDEDIRDAENDLEESGV